MTEINISKESRREFYELGVDQVRDRVNYSIWAEPKLREARAWLRENDPAWASVREARGAAFRSWIAIVISVVALAVAWFRSH